MSPRARGNRGAGLRMRHLLVAAAVVAVLVLGAAAIGGMLRSDNSPVAGMFRPEDPPMVAVPDVGGAYVEAAVGQPNYLNPILVQFNQLDRDLSSLIFSGLTRLDEKGLIVPEMAERWELEDDGKSYLFHLRRDVRWHDRTPFTADDVAFTVEAMQHDDFQGSPEVAELWRNVQVEQVDDYTVRFTMEVPFAPFLEYTTVGIIPRHLYADAVGKDMLASPYNLRPIGTGPFKLTKISAAGATLEPHADYHAAPPRLAQLQFRFYTDYSSAMAALERGEVDGLPYVEFEDVAKLRADEDLIVHSAPYYLRYGVLFLNNSSAPFDSKEVRQAVAHAVDREELIATALGGQGVLGNTPVSPASWAYDAKSAAYDYDPERAKELLEAAGWTDTDGNGVREKDGANLSFVILTNDNKRRIKLGELLAEDLREVGFECEVQVSGWTDLLKDYLATRRFKAVLAEQWLLTADPDVFGLWHSSQIGDGGFNFSGVQNERIDGILEEARRVVDRARRTELYREFQQVWSDELPSIVLYHPNFNWAVSTRVKDVRMTAFLSGSSRFRHVAEWYVKTKLVSPTPQPTAQVSGSATPH